ncbi:MAG: hypothetical protein VX000_14155, partial [Myxococcota bacterium]|nr:hypothetical protein [Myxococcota bacterium]
RLQAALEETRPQLFARAAQASRCGALDAAVRAAEDALDKRLGAVARSWLMLADTLPRPDAAEGQAGAFRRAAVRARVSLRTDRGTPREDLVAQAERRAAGPTEVLEAGLLRAELRWRQGDHAGARASLDAIAAEASLTAPSLSNRVRGRRACLELDAGQPAAALRACNRARRPDGTLPAWLAVVDRRASIWTGDPARALVSPSAPLVEARAHLLLGRPATSRAGLEVAWRTAMTRDGTTRAEARLLLARLELGDGRASVSRKMLEEVVLPRDAPAWLRPDRDAVALLLALFAGDTAAGDKLAVEPPACLPPDWAPLAVRWWRLRGRPSAGEAAIQAAATRLSGPWGRAMTDTLQAWVALATGDADAAAHAAARARDGAAKSGLADLGREAQ